MRATAIALAAVVLLAGCGDDMTAQTTVTNVTVTKGQQLIDLKAALDAHVITPGEYARERDRILDQ